MDRVLTVFQLISSVVLIVLILIQARGTGLGRSGFSSAGSFSRRGLEKLLFRLTFVFVFLFLLVSLLRLLV